MKRSSYATASDICGTATPLPVVLAKCTMCHEHYKQAKPGEPIGALSYTLRID